jgi:hypothetical protein
MNCELMLTYDTPALRQTGSRNLLYTPTPRRGRGVYCFPSVCPSKIFFVTFFSVTVDGRNLIFGHKRHIGTPYRGKHLGNVKTTKMNCELMLTYDTPALRQTGSRNLMGPKMLPTIWGTYMTLVTKYQISAINSD